jgi:hypothetical protein
MHCSRTSFISLVGSYRLSIYNDTPLLTQFGVQLRSLEHLRVLKRVSFLSSVRICVDVFGVDITCVCIWSRELARTGNINRRLPCVSRPATLRNPR